MGTMYFKVLSIVWGALMVLEGPVTRILGRRWARVGPKATDPEKQPGTPFWAWAGAMAALVLIAVTWAMYVKSEVRYSLAATLVVTLSLVQTSQVLFNYRRFRQFAVRAAVQRPLFLTALNVVTAVIGIGLILLGIFVYR